MRYISLSILIFCTFLILNACSDKVEAEHKDAVKDKTEKKISTNKNPKDVQMMTKLEGVWQSNQEPAAMQFFEDGSYRRYIPGGQNEPDAPEEEHDNGKWSVEAGLLLLKSEHGKRERIIISWIADNLIYLGNIEEEYDPKFGSKEEFAAEFGFSKIGD